MVITVTIIGQTFVEKNFRLFSSIFVFCWFWTKDFVDNYYSVQESDFIESEKYSGSRIFQIIFFNGFLKYTRS